jgi:flagellar biosynthesis component FlhA
MVDSDQDGGVFLYELIPAMRDRILASMGVTVPALQLRSDPQLSPSGYCIKLDEVPLFERALRLEASVAVVAVTDEARAQGAELADFHPLTGAAGVWLLAEVAQAGDDQVDMLTAPQRLIHEIERVMRGNLGRYLGPQEVAELVGTWSESDDASLVASVLPDADARLRLTWILQALVDEDVPIADWQAVLAAVHEAGGITAPTRALSRAVRLRLRDQLPGPLTGKPVVRVPAEHEAALLGELTAEGGPAVPSQSGHEFLRWLRQTVAARGPTIALVTRTQDAREVVSALARAEDRMIATLSEDELPSP